MARDADLPDVIPSGLEASLALLRHGESVYITEGRFQGQADNPLSPQGERQAQLAALRLAAPHRSPALPLPLRAPLEIVHSPLTRTTQTAGSVAAAVEEAFGTAVPLRGDPGVVEIGQGEWEGLPREAVDARWGDLLAAWRAHPTEAQAPGGERLVDVQLRVRGVIECVLGRLAAAGGVATERDAAALARTRMVAGYPGPLAPETPWSIVVGHDGVFKVLLLTLFELPLERFWSFPFSVCGITIMEIRDGRPVLRTHNVTEHLAPLLDERSIAVSEAREKSGAL
jgi:broad specificity phosphatase PhoE